MPAYQTLHRNHSKNPRKTTNKPSNNTNLYSRQTEKKYLLVLHLLTLKIELKNILLGQYILQAHTH